eukprot:1912628-Prymnesium_polylepis.1
MTVLRAPTFAGALETPVMSSRRSRISVVGHAARSRPGVLMHSCTRRCRHECLRATETALRTCESH